MKAIGVFDGGGVKGAALAGCLAAAESLGIEFVAYGGTSAGSIIATLAAVGYSGAEIKQIMVNELDFKDFLDDGGILLNGIKSFGDDLLKPEWKAIKWLSLPNRFRRHHEELSALQEHLGLYDADKLTDFLREKITNKYASLKEKQRITFADINDNGAAPLSIMAADITARAPARYSPNDNSYGDELISAVRASMSYPIIFRPVIHGTSRLVDGGLSSNLPVSLFSGGVDTRSIPILAFDLVTEISKEKYTEYSLKDYLMDILDTALESSEILIRESVRSLNHIPIPIPRKYKTLDFEISSEDREALYNIGFEKTVTYLTKHFPHWAHAKTNVARLKAVHGDTKLIQPALRGLSLDVSEMTFAENIRCTIMLPTPEGNRVVVYHYNMDDDPDCDLEIEQDSGLSGQAWMLKAPAYCDLQEVESDAVWASMKKEAATKVPKDLRAMISLPIFDLVSALEGGDQDVSNLPLIGTLTVDSTTPLVETGWVHGNADINTKPLNMLQSWADVLGKLLS